VRKEVRNWPVIVDVTGCNLQIGERRMTERSDANALVAAAKRAVERQRKIAATYRRRGLNARDAESRLEQLEQKLAAYEKEPEVLLDSPVRGSGRR
jgi:hypothetical protein